MKYALLYLHYHQLLDAEDSFQSRLLSNILNYHIFLRADPLVKSKHCKCYKNTCMILKK